MKPRIRAFLRRMPARLSVVLAVRLMLAELGLVVYSLA
jgi:hypothetical protein